MFLNIKPTLDDTRKPYCITLACDPSFEMRVKKGREGGTNQCYGRENRRTKSVTGGGQHGRGILPTRSYF